jgi:hypothetical protein
MSDAFYVYEHRMADSGMPFYVGKGSKQRAYCFADRTSFWKNIKRRHGVVVRLLATGLDEELAFCTEAERIDQLRRLGVRLCNFSGGGEGQSGYRHTEDTRRRMSVKRKGVAKPDSFVKTMTGRKRGPLSEEAKAKISAAKKGVPSKRKGRKFPRTEGLNHE